MTVEERKELVKQIATVGGGSDQLLELLKNLDEDIESVGGTSEPLPDGFESWSAALEAAKAETAAANKRYIDRFFDGDGKPNEPKEPEEVEKPDPEEEDKPLEYSDLFEIKEEK